MITARIHCGITKITPAHKLKLFPFFKIQILHTVYQRRNGELLEREPTAYI